MRGRWHADAGDGCWHHGSWLDRPGTAVVSCPAAALDTPQATWASLACAETPHGAVVRRPRLAVELPDGDGFYKIHVNTMEGFWSLLRSWLRPHRGISQEKLPLYLGFFEFVHNVRKRGKALLPALIELLVT